ncbi:hypothetical protein L1887_38302 [Cichorium endivia]|nr:hypothetical protein L1887_38302 [Cichorium endivia]
MHRFLALISNLDLEDEVALKERGIDTNQAVSPRRQPNKRNQPWLKPGPKGLFNVYSLQGLSTIHGKEELFGDEVRGQGAKGVVMGSVAGGGVGVVVGGEAGVLVVTDGGVGEVVGGDTGVLGVTDGGVGEVASETLMANF